MTDEDLVAFAREFRDELLDGRESGSMCFYVSASLSGLLRVCGVANTLEESDLGVCNHFWIKLADGRALDPTADQFNWCSFEQFPPVYLGPPTIIHANDSQVAG